MQVRIRFSKFGDMIYISHLDLVKVLLRAFKRAKINLKYSEGYNPHPKMVFASPLSLGFESCFELLDIEVLNDVSFEKISKDLSEQLPKGLEILKVYEPKAKFSTLTYSKYEILIKNNVDIKLLQEIFDKNEVVVEKRAKSSVKDVNIIPLIEEIKFEDLGDKIKIEGIFVSSPTENLNPDYVIKAIALYAKFEVNVISINRKMLYQNNLKEFN